MLEAYSSIKSNKLRVLLTAAIISIGIASLVGILTSIDGIKKSVSDSFSELGSNAYYIRSLRNDRGKESGVVKKNYPPIRYREISEFLKKYDGAGKATVSTTVTRIAEVKYKSEVTNPNVFVEAGDQNLVDVTQLKIENGRNFTKSENERGQFVAIIGSKLKSSLFKNNEEPLSKFVSVRGNKFQVIGVLEEKGSSFGGGGDNRIIIPIETSRKLRPTANYQVTIKVENIELVDDDINYSQNLFKIYRGDRIGSENSFEIERNESLDSELD